MFSLIDTHAHLYLPEFDQDLDKVIETAVQRGTEKIFLPNINSYSIEKMNQLADKYPEVCYPAIGLHPAFCKKRLY